MVGFEVVFGGSIQRESRKKGRRSIFYVEKRNIAKYLGYL